MKNLADIEILPYKLKEKEHDSGEFIFSYTSEGIIYAPKEYNGVVRPTQNRIMLLGKPSNLDIQMWISTLTHEILHFILFHLGVTENSMSEYMVSLLE